MAYIYRNISRSGYYVYAYLRSSNLTPYYIGKGSGNRAYDTYAHSVKSPKDKSLIIIIESGLTELGAFARERELIRWYGRKDLGTGILRNRTDGGDGVSGLIQTTEHRRKNSEGQKRRPPASVETRKKLRDALLGTNHSAERIENIKLSKVGITWWNNGKINTTSKDCPSPDWVRGRLMSEHHSHAIINSNKSRIITDAQKEKSRNTQLGNRWYNDGVRNTHSKTSPGPNWVEGRLPTVSLKGRPKSEETKARMRESWVLRKQKKLNQ